MRTVGLFEAKQKLSELVGRAAKGEKVGITRRGKLEAYIVPANPEVDVEAVFKEMDALRKHVKNPKGITARELIEEGRR